MFFSETRYIIKSINNLNFFANFYSVITALNMSGIDAFK